MGQIPGPPWPPYSYATAEDLIARRPYHAVEEAAVVGSGHGDG